MNRKQITITLAGLGIMAIAAVGCASDAVNANDELNIEDAPAIGNGEIMIPVEPDGGIGDGAGLIPVHPIELPVGEGLPTYEDWLASQATTSPVQLPVIEDEATIADGLVSGTVSYRERIALSPDAVIIVRLLDVSRMDAPSVTLAEQIIENPGQVPVAFELAYDPAEIDDRFTYAVRAEIRENGQLLFTTTSSYQVITRGNANMAELVLEKVSAAPEELLAPALLCMSTMAVQMPIEFHFGQDATPTGFDGINSARCMFPEEIEKITVVLTGVDGGPTHVESWGLPEVSSSVSFPLPADWLSMATRAWLGAGEYHREMTATGVSGETYDLVAQAGALGTVTILAD